MTKINNYSFQHLIVLLVILVGCQTKKEHYHFKKQNEDAAVIAIAYPISDINIDGDAKDWPKNLTKYPLNAFLENGTKDTNDLDAHFQIGYSIPDKSIYILLEVVDDIHIVNDTIGSLSDGQDQCLIYLDKKHSPKGSGVDVFSFNELYKDIDDASTSWDPTLKKTNSEELQATVTREGNKTIYEIRIKSDQDVKAGKAIGLDFMIYDNDTPGQEDEITRVSWRDTDGKTNVPFKLGNVLLIDEGIETGAIEGVLVWKKDSLGDPINKIRIASSVDPSFWIREAVDTAGYYTTQLPEGKYTVSPEWGIYNGGDVKHKVNKQSIQVEVKSNQLVKAPDLQIEIIDPLDILPEKGILIENPTNKHQQIDDFVSAYMEFFEIPGVSLAIIEKGKIGYHKTYGVTNTFSNESVSNETIFEAASITKPVFAFAVSRLAEKGIIDLDKPLHQYLPFEEIAYDERYKLITARHVLTHKTGFPNWRSGKMTILFKPGTEFGYSGEGFEYLKRVVMHITKKDIVEILNEEVLVPLDLKNIYFEKSDHLFKIVAHGHDDNYPHKVTLPNKAGMAWSMHTEAKSFSKFVIALIEKKGLKTETYEDIFFKHTTTDKYQELNLEGWESFFGLGIQLEQTPYGLAFGHGGNNGDFKCEFKVYKDLEMGFIIFTNGNTGDQLTNQALEQFLITGKVK